MTGEDFFEDPVITEEEFQNAIALAGTFWAPVFRAVVVTERGPEVRESPPTPERDGQLQENFQQFRGTSPVAFDFLLCELHPPLPNAASNAFVVIGLAAVIDLYLQQGFVPDPRERLQRAADFVWGLSLGSGNLEPRTYANFCEEINRIFSNG